jgi:hypothetical protein
MLGNLFSFLENQGTLAAAAIHGECFCTAAFCAAHLMAKNVLRSLASIASQVLLLWFSRVAITLICTALTWALLQKGFASIPVHTGNSLAVTLVAASLAAFFGSGINIATVSIVLETLLVLLFEDAAALMASAKRKGQVLTSDGIFERDGPVEFESQTQCISMALGFTNCLGTLLGDRVLANLDQDESSFPQKVEFSEANSAHPRSPIDDSDIDVQSINDCDIELGEEDTLMLNYGFIEAKRHKEKGPWPDEKAAIFNRTDREEHEHYNAGLSPAQRAETSNMSSSEFMLRRRSGYHALDRSSPDPFKGLNSVCISPTDLLDSATLAALWRQNSVQAQNTDIRFTPSSQQHQIAALPDKKTESQPTISPLSDAEVSDGERARVNLKTNHHVTNGTFVLGPRLRLDLQAVVSANARASKQEILSSTTTPRSDGSLSGRWPSSRIHKTRLEGQPSAASSRIHSGITSARSGPQCVQEVNQNTESVVDSRRSSSNSSSWSFACEDFGPDAEKWLDPPLDKSRERSVAALATTLDNSKVRAGSAAFHTIHFTVFLLICLVISTQRSFAGNNGSRFDKGRQ